MSETFSLEPLYEHLLENTLKLHPTADAVRIRAAYDCAVSAHSGQLRRDGTPYMTHPIAAAEIAVEMGLDEDSIISALLHDTIEDTEITYADLDKQFGRSVADIVNGVTKLTRVKYTSKEDEQMENLRKMLLAMAKDIRVILIKIADRLHNMRTMAYQSEPKQRSKSLETMQIYAPIAHRLGMQRVKWELEDLSLTYLDPIAYAEITQWIASRRGDLDAFMQRIEESISVRLAEADIHCSIFSRVKHIYSIYRKMYAQNLQMDQILDLCAFRVIVSNISDCYNVLGQIHDMYNPLPGRIKDYISTPKPNMYQSIHTTVIGAEGIPFEVQIRTWEMHHTAEYGIAAHWKYKSGEAGVNPQDTEKFAWIRRLVENQQDSEAQDFFHDLRIDMFADEVFVFSPSGDVINLPAGASPIDFAYSIHSAVGNQMIGAKVNGRIVTFGHVLQNGDIVEIITSKSAPGPSRDWMKIAKSGQARSKIKQWFKKERREENVIHGKAMFEAELKRNHIAMSTVHQDDVLPVILKKISVTSLDDLYAAIGYGGMTATRAVNRIKDELIRASKTPPKTVLDRLNEQVERNAKYIEKKGRPSHGILVEGIDNCLIKFSRCCTPVPGDDIIGFITRGYGVSVHRKDCPNYLNSLTHPEDSGRWISVSWADETPKEYITTLRIQAKQRGGFIMDVATVLNSMSAKVRSLSAKDIGTDKTTATVSLEVSNLVELRQVIARLQTIAGVSEVTRSSS